MKGGCVEMGFLKWFIDNNPATPFIQETNPDGYRDLMNVIERQKNKKRYQKLAQSSDNSNSSSIGMGTLLLGGAALAILALSGNDKDSSKNNANTGK